MARVGVCEDDAALRQIVRSTLEQAGCHVDTVSSGADAVRVFTESPPDVLVLDVGLPDADGRDVCQALRARGVESPVIFVSARTGLADRLSGFHAGGDDYLVKPFAASELAVRVLALARRGARFETRAEAAPDDLGNVLDPTRHAIEGGAHVALTPTEYRLLAATCAARGTIVRRGELLAAGWPEGAIVSDNTLDAYISRIRNKLRLAGRTEELANVRGVGYRLAQVG